MITSGRRGGAALFALAVGAVLAGGVAFASTSAAPTAPVASSLVAETSAPQRAIAAAPAPTSAPVATAAPTTPATTPPPPTRTAPPAPTTTAPKPVASGPTAQVVSLTNKARADAGCGTLTTDARLTRAAQGHSADMAENSYFEHDSQDGRDFAQRIEDAGYPSPGGENIAMGQRTAAAVVEAWMNSPGHRANIENCSFTTIGIGYDPDGYYWTQDFGR